MKNSKSLAIPEESVVSFEGNNYLFVKSNKKNTFELREAEIGNTENGWTQVLNSEIFQNHEIVVKGSYALLMAIKNKSDE